MSTILKNNMNLIKNSIKLGPKLPVVFGIFLILTSFIYLRVLLFQSSNQFINEFQKQNYIEMASADIMPITTRLNSLLSTISWVCIEAKKDGHVFYKQEQGSCASGFISQTVSFTSKPNNKIFFKFTLTFSNDLIKTSLVFLLIQALMLGLVIFTSKNYEKLKYQTQSQLFDFASQVSHDIRSPLSALEMITPALKEVPEENRIIMRNAINRIRDIANSLLVKNRELKKHDGVNQLVSTSIELSHELKTVDLLYPLIDSIISEKRLQYREFLKVRIEFNQTQANYGLFVLFQSSEFKRILSNIINNSVEALIDQQGVVEVSIINSHQSEMKILIHDNGKGIDSELVSKLGERGATFGKELGSGLGLYHAKESLKQWGGSIEIQSVSIPAQNHGTTVTLTLPKQTPPDWFVPSLYISNKKTNKIVVFDDDQTIHQIWQGRFESSGATKAGIELVHISSPHDFRKFYGANFVDLESILFLVDYEIIGHKETGLDLVEELGIQAQSILVTSRYEETAIRDRCSRLQIKLIPKPMSGFVPIELG